MKCHVNIGFGADFTDVRTIYEVAQTALPNKSMNYIELTPAITIPAGETLHLRVLPWHEHTSGSGKYILLRDVAIEGHAFSAEEGIENTIIADGVTKKIHNGQVYILYPDGTMYSILGVQVR